MPTPATPASNVICLTRERYRRRQSYYLLPHEDPVAFAKLRAELGEIYQPNGVMEELAVEQILSAMHRITRYRSMVEQLQATAPDASDGGKPLTPAAKERLVKDWQKLVTMSERSLASSIKSFHEVRKFRDAKERGFKPAPRKPRRPAEPA
ncbi:MAG TPA: hypothetical protein VFG43_00505 [Geminicoccaceae bacterium]|nr:hypothetical protein [Geminicoccaceae bacterium]